MRKSLVRLSLSLMFLAGAVTSSPSAEAACEYGTTVITTYYAYVDVIDPSRYWCQYPQISPSCPSCQTWQVIGQTVMSDCEGNSSWGNTTACTAPENIERTRYICGEVCE